MDVRELPLGQLLAPTRWDTHASGLAFDRKKILLPLHLSQAATPAWPACASGFLPLSQIY